MLHSQVNGSLDPAQIDEEITTGECRNTVVFGTLNSPFHLVQNVTVAVSLSTPADPALRTGVDMGQMDVVNTFVHAPGRHAFSGDLPLWVHYSGWWLDGVEPTTGSYVNLLEGNLDEVDPLFVDLENGDVNLQWGSPLIDAGDPDSPLDPDDTRADIGALYFDQSNSVGEDGEEAGRPHSFAVGGPYPNPFNGSTTIQVALPGAADVEVVVTDLLGREVMRQAAPGLRDGRHEISLDLSAQASGVYFLQVRAGQWQQTVRALLLK
jgi:hypothetical protein